MNKTETTLLPHQPYSLVIEDNQFNLDIVKFTGHEALSSLSLWEIEFTTTVKIHGQEQFLLKPATFNIGTQKQILGVINQIQWLSTNDEQSHYLILLVPRLALLQQTTRSAIYQNMSVIEVVEQLLREHDFSGQEIEFRLTHIYPERALITQWRETDFAFIQRLLSEVGINFYQQYSAEIDNDRLLFFDSQQHYLFGEKLPYRPPSGQYDNQQLAVWDLEFTQQISTRKVTLKDYHYCHAMPFLEASSTSQLATTTLGEHADYTSPYSNVSDENTFQPDSEKSPFFSEIKQQQILNNAFSCQLFTNAAYLTLGRVLDIEEIPIVSLAKGIVITQLTYYAARDTALLITIKGIPYSETYCYRPPLQPRPKIAGTLPARIESQCPNDSYAWLDKYGRYRVRLDFDRDNHHQSATAYLWLRLAKPYAGNQYGVHMPLMANTEVAIAFDNGNIDRPYIAFAFHDSEHTDPITKNNHTHNILRTPANNRLQMEDKRGKTHFKLATEFGNTQLNQGNLVDEQGKQRGTGLELRTDEWGAIRANNGLFISADTPLTLQDTVLEINAAIKEISHLQQQRAQLNYAAIQAKALQADIANQQQMLEARLKPLAQCLLCSAPEGVALTSGEHIQLTANQNISINSGDNISFGAMEKMTLSAKHRFGLFNRTEKLSIIANQGKMGIQAQNNVLTLFSQQKQTITSSSAINFTAKKRIILNGGGSYLRLEEGKIEYGTQGSYLRKIPMMINAAANTLPLQISQTAPICNENDDTI